MSPKNQAKPTYILLVVLIGCMVYATGHLGTESMYLVTAAMFATCSASAVHLFGAAPAGVFILLATVLGWAAEVAGDRWGWFFGAYDYTEVLGWKLLGVPIVIPVMWFNLCYVTLLISYLIRERVPFKKLDSLVDVALMAFLGAVLVVAYDLAADPHMVYVVKAWIMLDHDGWWFGETMVGFAGWLEVSFIILLLFSLYMRRRSWSLPASFSTGSALVPTFIYAACMSFQVMHGYPHETRIISAFAMGTPLLITWLGMKYWAFGK